MAILSTDTRLVRVGTDYSAGSGISIDEGVISVTGEFGKTYSAGENIDIYEQDEQLYISSKDWSDDIANASANAYEAATAQIPDPFDPSYLSAQIDNKLNSSDFTTWQNGQYSTDLQTIEGQINNKLDTSSFSDVSGSFLTAHQSLDNYYTKDETSGKEELAQAFADIPVGDPEVNAYVTNNSAAINGTTDLVQNSSGLWNDVAVYQSNSANYLTAHQDISYKLDESAFADVSGTFLTAINIPESASWEEATQAYEQNSGTYLTAHQSLDGYATVEDVESATSGKANTSDLLNYVPLSGIGDYDFAKLTTYGLSFSSKYSNSSGYGDYHANGISIFVKNSANLSQYAGSLFASQTGLNMNQSSAYGSAYSGHAELKYNSLDLKSVYGEAYLGFRSNVLLNIYTTNTNNNSHSFLTFYRNQGPSYSSENTGVGNFFIQTSANADVPRYNPVWIVRNGSGDGFSIGASEAKGFDKDGNTIWSTKLSKATQLINGSNDPKPAILLTPMPTTTAYTAQWTAAPYVSADYQSLTISYGPTASVPSIKIMPDDITTQNPSISGSAQFGVNVQGVKWQNPAGIWTLTGSVQKREIEYDEETSAITAIAGSAIGGGGSVTGEFVPQSAFDELKQSYDALSASYVTLSSLFATYSGQWLLPNEGEE